MNYTIKTLSDHFQIESHAHVARLSQLFAQARAPFELAYFHLDPGQATIAHHHDEQEIFICLKGSSEIQLDETDTFPLKKNEILFVEKNRIHQIINTSNTPIEMLAVWWPEQAYAYSPSP